MATFIEGNNSFKVKTSENGININYLNPYHPLSTMVVTIKYPVLPSVVEEVLKAPEVEISDVIDYLPDLREHLEIEGELYHLFRVLLIVASKSVSFDIVRDEDIYKYLVALYAGHMFELHLRDLKDEARRSSGNEEVVEKEYQVKNLENMGTPSFKQDLYTTIKGMRFYGMYLPLVQNSVRGAVINGKFVRR